MQISKFGNRESKVLDELLKASEKASAAKPESDFAKIAASVLSRPAQPTLREILSQFAPEAAPPAEGELPPAEGLDGGMGDDGLGGEGEPGLGESELDENSSVKENLAKALVELCGSPDEAKACIDQYCGSGMDELGGEMGGEEMVPEDIPEAEPLDDAPEMPAPMDMPM